MVAPDDIRLNEQWRSNRLCSAQGLSPGI